MAATSAARASVSDTPPSETDYQRGHSAEAHATSLLQDNISLIDLLAAVGSDDVIDDVTGSCRVWCEVCREQWSVARVQRLQETARRLGLVRRVVVAASNGGSGAKVALWLCSQLSVLFTCVAGVVGECGDTSATLGRGSDRLIGWIGEQLAAVDRQLSVLSRSAHCQPSTFCECTCGGHYKADWNSQETVKRQSLHARLLTAGEHLRPERPAEEKYPAGGRGRTSDGRVTGGRAAGLRGLLAALGDSDPTAAARMLITLSGSGQGCESLRKAGCRSLLVRFSHMTASRQMEGEKGNLALRAAAFTALQAVVAGQSEENTSVQQQQDEGEVGFNRVFELMRQLRRFNDSRLQGAPSGDNQEHPLPGVVALLQLSCDERARERLRKAGAVYTLSELFVVDTEHHRRRSASHASSDGDENGEEKTDVGTGVASRVGGFDSDCLTMRRLIAMTLTNLTYGQPSLRAELCSLRPFLSAVVTQLEVAGCEHSGRLLARGHLLQAVAGLLRNLSWRAATAVRQRLRHSGAASSLARAAMSVCSCHEWTGNDDGRDRVLSSVLSALWNMTGQCVESRSLLCSEHGWLAFLIETVRGRGQCVSGSGGVSAAAREVLENSTGVLRNLCGEAVLSAAGRRQLAASGCGAALVPLLAAPGHWHTLLHNVCATLCSLAAAGAGGACRARDSERRRLVAVWRTAALPLLHALTDSSHRSLAVASVLTLRYLFSCHDSSPTGDAGVPGLFTNCRHSESGQDSSLTAVKNGTASGVSPGEGTDPGQISTLLQAMASRCGVSIDTLCTRLAAYLSNPQSNHEMAGTGDGESETPRVPVNGDHAGFPSDSHCERPTDYSARYDETATAEASSPARMVRFISGNRSGDEPTDYSARYAEPTGGGGHQEQCLSDSVHMYATEGTPAPATPHALSTASSLLQLCDGEGVDGGAATVAGTGVATVNETPLVFSRSDSSLESMTEGGPGGRGSAHGDEDDRHSEASSIYSHPASGRLSPSELPDSPSQLARADLPAPDKTIADQDGDSDDDEMIYACIRSAMPTGRGRSSAQIRRDTAAPRSSTTPHSSTAPHPSDGGAVGDRTCDGSGDSADDDALLDHMIGQVIQQRTTARSGSCQAVPPPTTHSSRPADDQLRLYAVENTPAQFSTTTSLSDLTMDDVMPAVSASVLAKPSVDVSRVYATEDTPAVFSRCDSLSDICPRESHEDTSHVLSQQQRQPSNGHLHSTDRHGAGSSRVADNEEGGDEDGSETDDMLLERCINSAMPKSRSQSRHKRAHHHSQQRRVSNHSRHQQHRTYHQRHQGPPPSGSVVADGEVGADDSGPRHPAPSACVQSCHPPQSRGPRIVKPGQQSGAAGGPVQGKAVRGRKKALHPWTAVVIAPRSTRTTQLRRVVSAPLDGPVAQGPLDGSNGSAPASCANSPRPVLRRFGSTGKAGVVSKCRQRFWPLNGTAGGSECRTESAASCVKQDSFTAAGTLVTAKAAKSPPVTESYSRSPSVRSPSRLSAGRMVKPSVTSSSRVPLPQHSHDTRARGEARSSGSNSGLADVSGTAGRSAGLHNRRHRVIITHL